MPHAQQNLVHTLCALLASTFLPTRPHLRCGSASLPLFPTLSLSCCRPSVHPRAHPIACLDSLSPYHLSSPSPSPHCAPRHVPSFTRTTRTRLPISMSHHPYSRACRNSILAEDTVCSSVFLPTSVFRASSFSVGLDECVHPYTYLRIRSVHS